MVEWVKPEPKCLAWPGLAWHDWTYLAQTNYIFCKWVGPGLWLHLGLDSTTNGLDLDKLSVRTRTSLSVITAPVIPEYLRSYIIKHKQQNDIYQSHSSILLCFQKLSLIISSIEYWSSDISVSQRVLPTQDSSSLLFPQWLLRC